MGIVKQQSIRASVATYIGVVLGYVNIVILFPIALAPDQFGLTRILVGVAMIASQVGQLGIPNITLKYFPYFKNKIEQHNGFLGIVMLGSLAGVVITALILFIFRYQITGFYGESGGLFSSYYYLVIPITVFMVFTETMGAYARSLLRSVFFAFTKEVAIRVLHLVIILLFIYNVIGFDLFLMLFLANYGLQSLMMFVYLIAIGEGTKLIRWPQIGWTKIREMANYGVYMLMTRVPVVILAQIDVLMVGAILGLAESGIYAVAFFIAAIIQIPARNINQISVPLVAQAWKDNDLERIGMIYKKTALNHLIIGSFLLVIILVNFDNISHFLKPEYRDIFTVVLFIGLGKLMNMSAGVNGGIIVTSRYYKFDLATNVVLVVLVFLTNLYFIPEYKIEGAAFATALSITIYNLIKFIFVKVKLGLQPFTTSAFYALLIAGLVFLAGWYLPYLGNVYADLILRSGVVTLLFGSAVYLFRISEDINTTIDKIVKRLLK